MNKNVVAAITVISVMAVAGLDGWSVRNPQRTSPETIDSIVMACSPSESTVLLWIAEDQHFFEQNDSPLPLYILSTDNSFIRSMREVLVYEKK